MLRSAYKWILRLHPPLFQERFAQEMLLIFDLQKRFPAQITLLVDGGWSLLRQWTLRREFWTRPEENLHPAGAPLFLVGRSFTPRASALIDGALITAVTFSIVCLVMGHVWNQPSHLPIVSYYRAAPHSLAAQSNGGAPRQSMETKPLEPWYVDGGRVILVVQGHSAQTNNAH
jgi:hypothetical protein